VARTGKPARTTGVLNGASGNPATRKIFDRH
jgi:hypothetical protein